MTECSIPARSISMLVGIKQALLADNELCNKVCKLRKALELVPGVKEQGKEYARKDATRCPYRGMEMEAEG